MRVVLNVLGLMFAAIALMYFLVPAGHLPSQFPAFVYFLLPPNWVPSAFPGYEAGSIHMHVKHALVAATVAVILFLLGWFSGRKRY